MNVDDELLHTNSVKGEKEQKKKTRKKIDTTKKVHRHRGNESPTKNDK